MAASTDTAGPGSGSGTQTRSPAGSFLDKISSLPPPGPDRVILYLDIDGVTNPFAAKPTRRPAGYTTHRLIPTGWNPRKPLRVWLNPDHGRILNALAEQHVDIVWATTWRRDADLIATILGLPTGLPFVEFDENDPAPPRPRRRNEDIPRHPKTAPIVAHAAGRRFAWFDDLSTDTDRTWIADHHNGPFLVRSIDPAVGLTDADFTALADFAAAS